MANLGYLQLTRNCYQKCHFCSNPPTGVHLDEPEMRNNIDKLVEMGYDGVILTGGEPSTSELLLPALAYAREKKLFSRMITNGQKLADKDFFKRCVDAGLTHIHVSLHSYRREVHDFITQYRGAWDVLVRCLENVPEMGITSDINCVINVWNADHLHENVRWICENNAPSTLVNFGFTAKTFKAGDEVTVVMSAVAKNGTPAGRITRVILADGYVMNSEVR